MGLPAQATEQTWYCRIEHSAMISLPMQRFISSSVRQQEVMISLSATSTVFTKIMLSEESKHCRSIQFILLPGIAPSPLCRRPTARAASSEALSPSDRACCLGIVPPPSLPPFALGCIFALKVRCEGKEMRVSVKGMFFTVEELCHHPQRRLHHQTRAHQLFTTNKPLYRVLIFIVSVSKPGMGKEVANTATS